MLIPFLMQGLDRVNDYQRNRRSASVDLTYVILAVLMP